MPRTARGRGRATPAPIGGASRASRLVARLPTEAALGAIVLAAAAFGVVRGAGHHLPIVFGDELIYSGLAKGWALHGEPVLRGTVEVGYSTLYPLFAAPVFALAGTGATALEALKALSAVTMALTAVPAYLFARRELPKGWALGIAALSAFVPWTAYAALTLTESLFYPVFVAYAALLAWTLERPTWNRQVGLLALLLVLVGIRTQALAVVAGTVLAILIYGGARRFVPTFAALGAAVLAGLAAKAAGATLPTTTYDPVFDSLSRVGSMLKWAAWSTASFELALGVVAVAAFPLALRAMFRGGARSTAAVALGLTLSLLASVALLSASPFGLDRLHERSLFYVAPLMLTCLAFWLWQGFERPRWLAIACGAAAVVLAALLPRGLVFDSFHVDVPSALLFRKLDGWLDFRVWAVGFAIAGAAILVLAKRPLWPLLTVVLAFAAVTSQIDYGDSLTDQQARALSWVDDSLPADGDATLVQLGLFYSTEPCAAAAWWEQEHLAIWTEWFNTRIAAVAYLDRPNQYDGVPSTALSVGDNGLVLEGGRPLEPEYVIIDSRQPVTGSRVARFDLDSIRSQYRNGASLTLWRVDPPLRLHPRPYPFPPRGDGKFCQ